MVLFVAISIVYYSNYSMYPVFGKLYKIEDSESKKDYTLHAYCIGT